MNLEDKMLLSHLNGFLDATAIVSSPDRDIFYGIKTIEDITLEYDIENIISNGSEAMIQYKRNWDLDLRWLEKELIKELSFIEEKVQSAIIFSILEVFVTLFEERQPHRISEYSALTKLVEEDIEYHCEFNERIFLFHIGNDLIMLSFTYRK